MHAFLNIGRAGKRTLYYGVLGATLVVAQSNACPPELFANFGDPPEISQSTTLVRPLVYALRILPVAYRPNDILVAARRIVVEQIDPGNNLVPRQLTHVLETLSALDLGVADNALALQASGISSEDVLILREASDLLRGNLAVWRRYLEARLNQAWQQPVPPPAEPPRPRFIPLPSLSNWFAGDLEITRPPRRELPPLPPLPDPTTLPRAAVTQLLGRMSQAQNWRDVVRRNSNFRTIEDQLRATWAMEDVTAEVTEYRNLLTHEQWQIMDAAWRGGMSDVPGNDFPAVVTLAWVEEHYPARSLGP